MKVKLLLFPLSIIIALSMGIFWIQPEIAGILSARTRNADARERLDQISTIVSNIDALDQGLDERHMDESFVKNYLPEQENDDRILDQTNFLAGGAESLLVSTGMDRATSAQVAALAAAAKAAKDSSELKQANPSKAFINGSTAASLVAVPSNPGDRVRAVDLSLLTFGHYENIKELVERIYRSNSFQRFIKVKVSKPKGSTVGGDSPVPSDPDALLGEVSIRFSFLPPSVVSPGTFLPVFNRHEFDFSAVQDLRNRVTNEVMPLTVSPSPRQNPFSR